MDCPKCKHSNPEDAKFCTRCHAPMRFVCPACQHVQTEGGKCEKCGVDFAKYAGLLMFQMQMKADKERKKVEQRSAFWKQLFLLPITGGFSLIRYLFRRGRGD